MKPATLTITAENESKIYGNTLTFSGTAFTDSGLAAGDSVTSVNRPAPAHAVGAGGTYPIVPSAAVARG